MLGSVFGVSFMASGLLRVECHRIFNYFRFFGVSFMASGQIFFVCNVIEFSILFGVLACCTFFALKIFKIISFSSNIIYFHIYFPDIENLVEKLGAKY